MATIRKRGAGWQAQVRRKGCPPVCKTFRRKADAEAWAAIMESEIERGIFINRAEAENTSVAEALDRYQREVAPAKRSQRAILSRLKHLKAHLGAYSLASLNSSHLARYRDIRLKSVSPQSVKHELSLLNRVLSTAHIEWGITLPRGVPAVRRPKLPTGRERRLSKAEECLILAAFKRNPVMKAVVQFALETAMRRGEIAAVRWLHIDRVSSVLHIPETKTDASRTIPLSRTALKVVQALPKRLDGFVFGLRPDSITQAFDRACRRAGIENLRFHDLRHEGTSRLFERGLSMMEVASITGHRDLQMLKRYTHLRAADLVKKLG